MWYTYLNRNQHYMRSYRTHNLWFDYYHLKTRTPRVTAPHLGLIKRIAKNYSSVRNQYLGVKLIKLKTNFCFYID